MKEELILKLINVPFLTGLESSTLEMAIEKLNKNPRNNNPNLKHTPITEFGTEDVEFVRKKAIQKALTFPAEDRSEIYEKTVLWYLSDGIFGYEFENINNLKR